MYNAAILKDITRDNEIYLHLTTAAQDVDRKILIFYAFKSNLNQTLRSLGRNAGYVVRNTFWEGAAKRFFRKVGV